MRLEDGDRESRALLVGPRRWVIGSRKPVKTLPQSWVLISGEEWRRASAWGHW